MLKVFVILILIFVAVDASKDFFPEKWKHPALATVDPSAISNGMVIKGNRNALFLVRDGTKQLFPDFYTFTKMGYNMSMIRKIPEDALKSIPLGPGVQKIEAPPEFRPDDYMFHAVCNQPERMVNDLGIVQNMGNYFRYLNVLRDIKQRKHIDILALGGSITAGGYFMEFKRLLEARSNLTVTVHNHGHGATELTYTIFCVDIDRYRPHLVLIDFSVNDYGHPKLMDALIRKAVQMPSRPVVALVNLWVHPECPITRYLLHAHYYDIPVLNLCPAVNLCFGKHLPRWRFDEYTTKKGGDKGGDGVHPWGPSGVPFIGGIMYNWWRRYEYIVEDETPLYPTQDQTPYGDYNKSAFLIPPPLYVDKPIGRCTRCDALAADSDARLEPIGNPVGFRIITRTKVGYGGFNPDDRNSSTKSFKRSWQADTAGSTISFKFYGSTVRIAMWQRRDGMGVLHATVDGDESNVVKASGFFKGYTWAMDRNNTGRSEIVTLFEGLPDSEHVLKLTVSNEPANVFVKGHTAQIFALLSSSDNLNCKSMILRPSH